jgi:peptidoglycan/LPS O-acetylase OafA/YrhL
MSEQSARLPFDSQVDSTGTPSTKFRPDIQALRAIAVLLVLVYHLWPNRLTGGYIGVDVFFVISGFLIGGQLRAEYISSGTIRLGSFWARRARRLLPASLLVLLVSTVLTIFFVSKFRREQFLLESISSTLYVQNWELAYKSVDYMRSETSSSLVEHFWSLSAEEQFYIIIPIALFVIVLLARTVQKSTLQRERIIVGLYASITVISFVWSVYSTPKTSMSYFSTATRAWEFGVGALLSCLCISIKGQIGQFACLIGLGAIAACSLLFNSETQFPGWIAIIPVSATALAIMAGLGSFVESCGTFLPVAILGRISYSVYLWHFPLISITPLILGRNMQAVDKFVIATLSLVVGWLTQVLWEDPVRFSKRFLANRKPRVIAAWSVGGMALVICVTLLGIYQTQEATQSERIATQELIDSNPPCLGAVVQVDSSCVNVELEGQLFPPMADLDSDYWYRPDCFSVKNELQFNLCSVGPSTGYDLHILAIGDSHHQALGTAYESIAQAFNWRIDLAGNPGCYWANGEYRPATPDNVEGCNFWKDEIAKHINSASDLDAIIITKSRLHSELYYPGIENIDEARITALVTAWNARPDKSIPIVAIEDNPLPPKGTLDCVARFQLDSTAQCSFSLEEGYSTSDYLMEAVLRVENAKIVSMRDLYCLRDTCSPVIGNVIVYRDDSGHLSDTYIRTLAPYLGERIASAIES